ncbi:Uncharacterised protein [uncultured archaeon]|nr:Uncharacterised protein [uncultured archaeon]
MAKKPKSKSTASTASSWWSERSKILASITKPKPVRARPKIKKAKAKAKPKRVQTKKVVKAKKVMKMKKATKAKRGKAKRTK